jgi:hypothetical protein
MSKRGSVVISSRNNGNRSSSERELSSTKEDDETTDYNNTKDTVKGESGDLTLSKLNKHNPHPHHHRGPSTSSSSDGFFLVSVTGRIESAQIFGVDDVYCKYNLAMGNDWFITAVRTYER